MNDLKAKKSNETYEKIIIAAIDIISIKGVAGISAGKVAKKAGVCKSTIFHHFDTIELLPLAVFDRIMKIYLEPIDSSNYGNYEDILDTFEEALFCNHDNADRINRTFFAFLNEAIFNKNYQLILKKFQNISIERMVRQIQKIDYTLDIKIARSISRLIISLLDGLAIHIMIGNNLEDFFESWKLLKRAIINILKER